MMYAIIYTDPKTKTHYVCTSSGDRKFYVNPSNPQLFEQLEDAEKVIYNWQKLNSVQTTIGGAMYKFHLDNIEIDSDHSNVTIAPVRFKYELQSATLWGNVRSKIKQLWKNR